LKKDMDVMHRSSIKMVSLKGMEAAPSALTTVFWDSTSHNVYLLIIICLSPLQINNTRSGLC
jgi:hypothetical protein